MLLQISLMSGLIEDSWSRVFLYSVSRDIIHQVASGKLHCTLMRGGGGESQIASWYHFKNSNFPSILDPLNPYDSWIL